MVKKNGVFLYLSLLLALLWCVAPRLADARPASQALHELKQADGTTFKARQWGDEFYHGWETEDGYSIVFDETSKNWEYAVNDSEGKLVSSNNIVGKDAPPKDATKHLRLKKSELKKVRQFKSLRIKGLKKAAPVTGTGKLPVVLVNFSDTDTQFTKADFQEMLFGTGVKSMNDYYKEVSYGQYGVSGEISDWVTASNTHDYYGQDDPADKNNKDVNVIELVYEAVKGADAALDFSKYVTGDDCKVDAVAIIHQGTDQANTGIKTDIWSHQGYISYSDTYTSGYTTNDICKTNPSKKVTIDKYFIQNETADEGNGEHMSTIGVFVHEFGHALGLPDFYDTDYSSSGTGRWDVMAAGFNTVALAEDTPAHFNPWAKYFLGWVTPTEVTQPLLSQQIKQAATAADVYKMGTGDTSSGEYFLVENRQLAGFDEGLPGAGLLIWHVDAGWIASHLDNNDVNNYSCVPPSAKCSDYHYGVALVQADNKWDLEKNKNDGDDADPFPGSKSKRTFGPATLPGSNFYDGSLSNAHVSDISDPAAVMTASLSAVPQYYLTVNHSGTGTVSDANGDLYCGKKGCYGLFDSGSAVELNATAGKGYLFKEWTGCTSVSGSVCTVKVSADTAVTAVFAKSVTLTVKKSGSGSVTSSPDGISCGSTCKANYMSPTTVVLTAAPDAGYAVSKWTGCSSTSASGDSCTVKVDKNKTVSVKFKLQ